MLFLVAMWFSPLASVIPAQATAPALIIVGFYMMSVAREIAWDDYEEAIPAFVTMLVMPFTWSITNGIGARLRDLRRHQGAQRPGRAACTGCSTSPPPPSSSTSCLPLLERSLDGLTGSAMV